MKKIAIIVLNWKQPQLTIDTIDNLLLIKNTNFDYKIFLINNNLLDESFEILNKKYNNNPIIQIESTGNNLGYAGGNNFGIQMALEKKFDYILLLNNDVLVDPGFLEKLYLEGEKDKKVGILGPKIYFAPGFEYHKDRYKTKDLGKVIWSIGGQMDWNNILGSNIGIDEVDNGQFEQPNTDLDFISGCCMLVKSQVFQKIGQLDKNYFMYLEDVDICQRAKRSGFNLKYIPTSKIWHINSGSSKSGGDLHDYFITRNRLYFSLKYARLRTKIAILKEALKNLFFSKSKWKKQAIKDFFVGKLNKGSWV